MCGQIPEYDANLLRSGTLPNRKKETVNVITVNIIKSHAPNVILDQRNVDVKIKQEQLLTTRIT